MHLSLLAKAEVLEDIVYTVLIKL